MASLALEKSTAAIKRVEVQAYQIPTDKPESDGTLAWDSTTINIVHIRAGGHSGLGYTYSSPAAADLIRSKLAEAISGKNALDIPARRLEMFDVIRNNGQTGICSMAIAAVDMALWDLKAKYLDVPLVTLLGRTRAEAPAYGSGGFTTYSLEELREQLGGWAAEGFRMVKMKIGTEPHKDPQRVEAVREAVGPGVEIFVDANGAFDHKQALDMANTLAEYGVTWYEEPVYHLDFDGLTFIRDRCPSSMEVSAGEYGFETGYFRKLLESKCVDALQADITRCGVSGFLETAELCKAFYMPLSAHTAPSISTHLICAVERGRHLEYFHDHVRIENMLFDGVPQPENGHLAPDLTRSGHGLGFKEQDARKFEV